ncbi:hypothetical protein [Silvibacterium acidisoli]|uniref:hypothetical protein n=1 Tax=Acidobacteriaceae bacterium ZG23-2 TaxID=2883246 RepID=UPI00406BF65C
MQIKLTAILRLTVAGCLAALISVTGYSQQPANRPGPPQNNNRPGPQPGNKPGPQPGNRPKPQPGNRPAPKPNPPQNNHRPGNPGNRPNPSRPNPGQRPGGNGGRPPVHRPPAQHRPPSHRPPQWGRPPARRPSYNFRPGDRDRLRRYYAHRFSYINRARRPVFSVGGYFPYGDIGYLSPLPGDLYSYMPPPPPGYQMGYFDGYVVVYDPLTYFIANVVDLLQ